MSDPLSVAGTAVGIISLGLQVCGEIVSFCQAWRGFNEDIQNITEKADGLRMPLRALREMIEDFRTTDPTIASDLETKAMSIERAIKRLKTATDRYASTTSDTDSLRFQLKKAAYPFRKEGLRDMASDLDSIQLVLHTALQIYSAQSTRALLGRMTQEMQEMNLKLRDLPKQFMPPPSLIQSWCAQQEQLPALSSSLQMATQDDHITQNTSVETSRDKTRSDPYRTGQASVVRQHRNSANSECTSRSRPPRGEKAVIKTSYYYCSHLLNIAIEASFSFKTGAGGFSIAPLLYLQPILGYDDSLGHRILVEFTPTSHEFTPDRFESHMDHTLQQLQQAFDLRKATPFDLMRFGDREVSLFDYVCYLQGHWMDSLMIERYLRLLNFLLDCGSKPNMNSNHGNRLMHTSVGFALFKEGCSLGSRLLDLGCFFTIRKPRSLAERQIIRYLASRGDESIQIPKIVKIIALESEDELRDVLKSGTASPNDTIDGISPSVVYGTSYLIDFAFGWPKGIQILLEAGATPGANDWRFPWVEDNDNEDTYHSIKFLLQAGCSFSLKYIKECEHFESSDKIKSLLINEMATRRKRLWHLAQSCLPVCQLPTLISRDEKTGIVTILDVHTPEICSRLLNQGISIGPAIRLNSLDRHAFSKSVYHYQCFSVETLDELYKVGFRGVSQPDSQGCMPLLDVLNVSYGVRKGMERIVWLVSKGADPYQEVPGTSATTAHHLGLGIVDYFLENHRIFGRGTLAPKGRFEVWKQTVSNFARGIFLLPSVRDECACQCSPSGCTTMSVLLRHIVDSLNSKGRMEEPSFWFREVIQFLIWWTREDTGTGWEVVRFLTFDTLGLKHTCCIENHGYLKGYCKLESREEEEIEEILDEEKLRLIELEELLDELKIKFDDFGQPVMEFLDGYWHTRMIEVLSKRDPYDEEHVIESRRIGVMLEPDECVFPDRVSLLSGSKIMYEIST